MRRPRLNRRDASSRSWFLVRAHTITFIVYCAIPWRRWRQFSLSLTLSPSLSPPGEFNRQTTKRHSGQAALACAPVVPSEGSPEYAVWFAGRDASPVLARARNLPSSIGVTAELIALFTKTRLGPYYIVTGICRKLCILVLFDCAASGTD